MNKLLITILTIALGCNRSTTEDLFILNNVDIIASTDSINTIDTFNNLFWRSQLTSENGQGAQIENIVFRFDFNTGKFTKYGNHGIRLKGLPYDCYTKLHCISRSSYTILLDKNYDAIGEENNVLPLSEVRREFLQTLSDRPQDAITEIYLDSTHRIVKIDFLLSALTDEYAKFISKRRIQESDRSTEDLVENFPLHLCLRKRMYPIGHMEIIAD